MHSTYLLNANELYIAKRLFLFPFFGFFTECGPQHHLTLFPSERKVRLNRVCMMHSFFLFVPWKNVFLKHSIIPKLHTFSTFFWSISKNFAFYKKIVFLLFIQLCYRCCFDVILMDFLKFFLILHSILNSLRITSPIENK